MKKKSAKPTIIDSAALMASHKHHPKPATGRVFSSNRLPKDFHTVLDPSTHPQQPWRDLPPAQGLPPFRLSLDSILAPDAMASIVKSGMLVFHSVGDTGGVNTPTQIENVESYMEMDFSGDISGHPSFFYHLGDVVYYDGELSNYYPEFYEPYINYPAPIVAIPGNHDGDMDPQTGESSLEGFMRNFCTQVPTHTPEGKDAPRMTMTQPYVYWTLLTPLVTIVGLYSNCPEGGQLAQPQIDWFEGEIAAAPKDRALIVAVHHPVYSAYGSKPGSTHLKSILEGPVKAGGRIPELVLSGHVHNYQRFAGFLNGNEVPMIIAGAGGYNAKLHTLSNVFHSSKLPVKMVGSDGLLESFCDNQHGYLRITVTKKQIDCEYVAVPDPASPKKEPLKAFDSVTIKTNY